MGEFGENNLLKSLGLAGNGLRNMGVGMAMQSHPPAANCVD
jgi:hypothetical protein